jgi:hypothetical protein
MPQFITDKEPLVPHFITSYTIRHIPNVTLGESLVATVNDRHNLLGQVVSQAIKLLCTPQAIRLKCTSPEVFIFLSKKDPEKTVKALQEQVAKLTEELSDERVDTAVLYDLQRKNREQKDAIEDYKKILFPKCDPENPTTGRIPLEQEIGQLTDDLASERERSRVYELEVENLTLDIAGLKTANFQLKTDLATEKRESTRQKERAESATATVQTLQAETQRLKSNFDRQVLFATGLQDYIGNLSGVIRNLKAEIALHQPSTPRDPDMNNYSATTTTPDPSTPEPVLHPHCTYNTTTPAPNATPQRANRSPLPGNPRFDLIPTTLLHALAITCGEGAEKYGDFNWLRGFMYSTLLNHALNHLNQWRAGDTSEPHLAHAIWNMGALLHFQAIGRTDLDDRNPPAPTPTPEPRTTQQRRQVYRVTARLRVGKPVLPRSRTSVIDADYYVRAASSEDAVEIVWSALTPDQRRDTIQLQVTSPRNLYHLTVTWDPRYLGLKQSESPTPSVRLVDITYQTWDRLTRFQPNSEGEASVCVVSFDNHPSNICQVIWDYLIQEGDQNTLGGVLRLSCESLNFSCGPRVSPSPTRKTPATGEEEPLQDFFTY